MERGNCTSISKNVQSRNKLRRKRRTHGPQGKRASSSINKFFTHCPKEAFREKHDFKVNLLPPAKKKDVPGINRNRIPINCSLSKNYKLAGLAKGRPLTGISLGRRVKNKTSISGPKREEPGM